jgi:hypothetical protein
MTSCRTWRTRSRDDKSNRAASFITGARAEGNAVLAAHLCPWLQHEQRTDSVAGDPGAAGMDLRNQLHGAHPRRLLCTALHHKH